MKQTQIHLPLQGCQAWGLIGANAADLDAFFLGLTRAFPQLAEVSFRTHQAIYEDELKKDDTDFLDRLDPGTPARDFLPDTDDYTDLIQALGMAPHLDTGYRGLSTGQSRKLILLRALMSGARGLLLLDPFDGLDPASCRELDQALEQVFASGRPLVLCLHNREDLPAWCTHVGMVNDTGLTHHGSYEKMAPKLAGHLDGVAADFQATPDTVYGEDLQKTSAGNKVPLIQLTDGHAGYNGVPVFEHLDFTVRPGEHTLVTGPNGCGKSTLLSLVTGDHPACYQNDLTLFGIRRGSGESIWDLKKRMGIVSPALHRDYRVPGDAVSCVLSGLFDSVGLYVQVNEAQTKQAIQWLERLGMTHLAATPFRELSFARQRLILIARALIKGPELLVLDEPTQGLDQANRNAVLDFLEAVADLHISTILYVSHRQDEYRPFFTHQLELGQKS